MSAVRLYESQPHRHPAALSKRELVQHLAVPHRQVDGTWKSLVSQPRGWTRDELKREHDEFHGGDA